MDYRLDDICPGWIAEWIWKDNTLCVNDFAYFRKEFCLEQEVLSAKVFVSAHNHFELFVNGSKVSGYLVPAPSHPEKSKLYLCYNVTDLLKPGKNIFCSTTHFIGGGGQNYVNGLPGFILQCHIFFTDGFQKLIATDTTWKIPAEVPFKTGTAFQQKRKLSAILDYDSSKEETGWLFGCFDDSHWKRAVISDIQKEKWVLMPQKIQEGRVHETILPLPAGIQLKSDQVFDTGKIVTGWPRLELAGIKGKQIMVRYSEELNGEGQVKHNVCNEASENYYDLYTMKGEPLEVWEPCYSYKAFRYVEVTGYPEILKPGNIKIISAGTGLSYKGLFNSSNKLLNDIYKACIQTQINNITGQMVDCPHREQAQYLADADLQAETFTYNFSNPEVLKKVLKDFMVAQQEDGRFPFVYPSNIDNPEFNIWIPEWDLHFITLLWKTYFIYDDIELLNACYNSAKKAVSYYYNIMNEQTGLVPRAGGFPSGWNISDWPYPDIDQTGDFLTVQNCKLYHVTKLMAKAASILGLYGDSKIFLSTAANLKNSILEYLYNPEKQLFADSYQSEQSHQGSQVVAFRYGLVPEKDKKAVLSFIIDKGFSCSTLLTLDLLRLLFDNGRENEAFHLLNRTAKPGWGHMIAKGYKTIWEGFNDTDSHCHAWNAYPARLLTEYLVGIKPTAPGFGKIDIKPFVPSVIQFAEGRVPTVKGDIYVRWTVDKNILRLKATLPANITARIILPGLKWSEKNISGAGEYILETYLC